MWVDLPPVTSAEISSEFQKPQAGEVVSVWECKLPDFQAQFDDLQKQTADKVGKLQEQIQYSETQKEILRKIYCNLPEKQEYKDWDQLNSYDTLRQAIEKQTMQLFDIPWKEEIAISVDWNNVDFIYKSDWEKYFDFMDRRMDVMRYSAYKWVISDTYKETESNWKYTLFKDWVEIETFSDKWLNSYFEISTHINWLVNWLEEVWEMDWDQVLEE